MKFLKKYWYLIFLLLFTVGLGVLVFITSQQLAQTKTVAPTVAQVKPKAAAAACKLAFNITLTPTCGSACTTNADCPTDHSCSTTTSKCVLTACLQTGATCDETNCTVTTTTPTPTPTPTATPTPTPTATPTPTPTATPTPPQLASCNNTCTVNADCSGGLVCIGNACRNSSCTDKTNCQCQVTETTPTPTQQEIAVVTPTATPKIPVSGTGPSVLGASVIGGGLLILLLGLAL